MAPATLRLKALLIAISDNMLQTKLFIFSSDLLLPHIFPPQLIANPSSQSSSPKPWSHPCFLFLVLFMSSSSQSCLSPFKHVQNIRTTSHLLGPPTWYLHSYYCKWPQYSCPSGSTVNTAARVSWIKRQLCKSCLTQNLPRAL